jgi:hypothetical protein
LYSSVLLITCYDHSHTFIAYVREDDICCHIPIGDAKLSLPFHPLLSLPPYVDLFRSLQAHVTLNKQKNKKQKNRYRVRAVGEVVVLVMPYGNFVECFRGREGTKLREAFKRHREPVLNDNDIATAVLGRSSGSGTTTTAAIRRTLGRRHSDPGYLPSIQERRSTINSNISRTIGGGGGGGGGGSGVDRGGRGGSGGVHGGSGGGSGGIVSITAVGRQHHSGVTSGSSDVVRTTDRVPSASAARGRRTSSAATSTHRGGRLSSTSPAHTMMTSFGADVRGRSDLEPDHASDLVLREERRAIFHPLISVGSEVSDKPETTKVCSNAYSFVCLGIGMVLCGFMCRLSTRTAPLSVVSLQQMYSAHHTKFLLPSTLRCSRWFNIHQVYHLLE